MVAVDHWREGAWKPDCRLLATRSQQQVAQQPATSSLGTRVQPPKLELADRIGVADHLCVVLQAGQSFMRDLGREHEEHVSHGDHVPIALRNAAAGAFWLPDCLGVESQITRKAEAQGFWSLHVSELCVTAGLSLWPSVWQHTLGHLTSSCGPHTGI